MRGSDWVKGIRFSNSVMELFNIHNYCSAVMNGILDCYGWHIALLWVQCVLLCVACHAMTGMGNRLQDRMTTAGVAGDDQVTCMGHGQHDTLGE